MKNGDKLENKDAVKTENKDSYKKPKEYELIINDDKKKLNMWRNSKVIMSLYYFVKKHIFKTFIKIFVHFFSRNLKIIKLYS